MDSDRDAAALRRQLADPLLAATHPVYRPLLWTLLGCVLLFIGWAAWAQLDEVTRGDGRVVPFSRIQKIQSLEGGILDRLLVKEGTQAIQRQIHLAQSQLDLVRPLVAKRAVSQMEALKLSQDIATLSGKLTELKSTYFQDAYTERAQRKADLSALEPIVQQRQDQLRRTEILSPVRGRVNTVLINTRGGVIQPGEPIMEVIPVEERLLVEAKIKPRDVAFLVPGMPAKVKITAYDYTIYGDLKGTLEQISADTIEEDTPHGKESYYQVLIKTDGSQLKRGEEVLPIIPGMVAEVDILSGKRSVLNYLLRPLIKARLY
ncbi:TPA: HlyD family efflux transporter periplasmic adaptor subunit [Pseudomonas aeruginosa]|nr:HlyD family efflux transporter periplasmic adaptor subunit [Pseudomonas aeruginosa]